MGGRREGTGKKGEGFFFDVGEGSVGVGVKRGGEGGKFSGRGVKGGGRRSWEVGGVASSKKRPASVEASEVVDGVGDEGAEARRRVMEQTRNILIRETRENPRDDFLEY